MNAKIDDHELTLTGITPKIKIDKELLTAYFANNKYNFTSNTEASERYPNGATCTGTLNIFNNKERNGFEIVSDAQKVSTQANDEIYQVPIHAENAYFCDRNGYGHIITQSSHGSHFKGVITKLNETVLEAIVHGDSEHNGMIWIKHDIIKTENTSYQFTTLYKTELSNKWSKHSNATITAII